MGKRGCRTEGLLESMGAKSRRKRRGGRGSHKKRNVDFHRVLLAFLEEEYVSRQAQGTLEELWTISRVSSRFNGWGGYQWRRFFHFVYHSSGQDFPEVARQQAEIMFKGLQLWHYLKSEEGRDDASEEEVTLENGLSM